jgi:hypothetical protein
MYLEPPGMLDYEETSYSHLSRASEEDFPAILSRLQVEWNWVGTTVCSFYLDFSVVNS